MIRYGKPIKNKKHIDPRYFLHENQERLDEFFPGGDFKMPDTKIIKAMCAKKSVIIGAIKGGKLSQLMALGKLLGLVPEEATLLTDTIVQLAGVNNIDELLADSNAREAAAVAIEAACALSGMFEE